MASCKSTSVPPYPTAVGVTVSKQLLERPSIITPPASCGVILYSNYTARTSRSFAPVTRPGRQGTHPGQCSPPSESAEEHGHQLQELAALDHEVSHYVDNGSGHGSYNSFWNTSPLPFHQGSTGEAR